MGVEYDFSGYATKAGLKCSDGRTITAEAFKDMHGTRVPLVWQHGHNNSDNVLGHALLQARQDGIYAYGFFNTTKQGENARALVEHEDVKHLSIYANQLVEKSKTVLHGVIREVSLVLSGANPGALIDFVRIQHSDDPDDFTLAEEDAVIYTGLELSHASPDMGDEEDEDSDEDDEDDEDMQHADGDDLTVKDVYDSMSDEQKNVLHYMIGAALEQAGANSAEHADTTEGGLTHKEGTAMNVFEQNADASGRTDARRVLSHEDVKGIVGDAMKCGSMKEAVERYALQHGIENIDVLFPDAKTITNTPEFDKRRTEWVSSVLAGTRHTPFSRVKTITADITQDEARAKGYIKGRYKVEEWFGVTKRTTSPTTVYKKQKLDRDDIQDITDFDIVMWLKAEMRLMLEEELARAILIGDGREVSNEDKIKDPVGAAEGSGIRSIANDHELYATTLTVNVSNPDTNYEAVVDAVIDGMEFYKGTGTPVFYTTLKHLNMFLKAKDGIGRRYYKSKAEVAEALGVSNIVTVEPMNEVADLIGIIVNLSDYNTGTDKGGEINLFDDFDIDYNQYKYLMETRLSGALTKVKAALVIRKTDAGNALALPQKPSFDAATGVITIPTVTGVVYKDGSTTLNAGAQTALAAGASKVLNAVPASGFYFANTVDDGPWTFKRNA